MQNDLISRSALIKALSEKYSGLSDAREETDFAMYTAFKQIVRIISNQPTAYSVEELVEKTHEIICNTLESVLEPLPDGSEYTEEAYRLLYLNTRISDAIRNGGKE